jgi:hypothetical protein
MRIDGRCGSGAAKWSRIGVEDGPWGLLGFSEIQTLNVKGRSRCPLESLSARPVIEDL